MSRCDLRNDPCALRYLNDVSQSPLQHKVQQGAPQCQPFCQPTVGTTPNIDVSNYINGLSGGPYKKWCPTRQAEEPKYSTPPMRECKQLQSEPTRLMNPPMKEISVSRWDYTCPNMQGRSNFPCFDFNVNSRNVMKDNHKPVVKIPPPAPPCQNTPSTDSDSYSTSSAWNGMVFPSTHTATCGRLDEITGSK